MPREQEELEARTIRFFKGELDRLKAYYPHSGYNPIVRKMVRQHLRILDKRKAEKEAAKGVLAHDNLEVEID